MLRTILGVVSAELDIKPAYKVLQTFTRRHSASAPVEAFVSDILFHPFAGCATNCATRCFSTSADAATATIRVEGLFQAAFAFSQPNRPLYAEVRRAADPEQHPANRRSAA